jgi:hypothetical protein
MTNDNGAVDQADTNNIGSTASGQSVPVRPRPQSASTLVYHEELQRVVLVSGFDRPPGPDPAEVWTFDGTRWERLQHPGPDWRYLAAAAYDSKRKQIVLFGGRAGKPSRAVSETWLWDTRTWREVTDPSVGVREHHFMAYDARHDRIVMYGGTAAASAEPGSAVTRAWPEHVSQWKGARWQKISASGPGARNGAAIVYDSRRKHIVMFGGIGEDRQYRPGTWILEGDVWRKAASEDPPLRATHQMVFDSRAGVVLLYGGGFIEGTRGIRRGDMWRWDGKRWTAIEMSGPTPGPRVGHAMAYDRKRGRAVLFGGCSEGTARWGIPGNGMARGGRK